MIWIWIFLVLFYNQKIKCLVSLNNLYNIYLRGNKTLTTKIFKNQHQFYHKVGVWVSNNINNCLWEIYNELYRNKLHI